MPWDTQLKCNMGMEKGGVCDTLGQTHAKALGKLAKMSLCQIQMERMLCINQCKTVGWALEKHEAAVPPLHCGPMSKKGSSQGQGWAGSLWHGVCMAAGTDPAARAALGCFQITWKTPTAPGLLPSGGSSTWQVPF